MNVGIAVAIDNADRLGLVLNEEFQALSTDDIDGFEKLQSVKSQLLALLTAFVQTLPQPAPAPTENAPVWEAFYSRMQECRNNHQRNEILIRSRLEAIRGTLRILQNSSEQDSAVQLYDRLGRVSEGYGRKRYTDA
mgnify:CR=1 FL=1